MSEQSIQAPSVPSFREAGRAALVGRVTVVAAGLASAALVPVVMARDDVGAFFVATLVVAALATVCQCGLTVVGPGMVSSALASGELATARRLVRVMLALCLGAGTCVVVLLGLVLPWLTEQVGVDPPPRVARLALVTSLLAAVTALAAVVSELLRSVHAVRAAALVSALVSVFAAGYAAVVLLLGERATVSGLLLTCVVGSTTCTVAAVAVLLGTTREWSRAGRPAGERPTLVSTVRDEAVPAVATTLVLLALASADLIVVSVLGSLGEVAHYGLAARFATMLLVPLGIANGAAAPLAVHARTAGDHEELGRVLDGVVRHGALSAAAVLLVFAASGYWAIRAWSADYVEVYGLGLVLGLGAVLHACGGAAGVLLMVWGDQRGALRLTLASGVVTVVACVAGYEVGGSLGLAFGAAAGNALQAVLFTRRVRSRFGTDPSVRRLLARTS